MNHIFSKTTVSANSLQGFEPKPLTQLALPTKTSILQRKGSVQGLLSLVAAAQLLSLSQSEALAASRNKRHSKKPVAAAKAVTNQEAPFPLEKSLGLKTPIRSGIVSDTEFKKLETAFRGALNSYLSAIGSEEGLKTFREEIEKKPNRLKVGRVGLDWLLHGGKKKSIPNTAKTELLKEIGAALKGTKAQIAKLQSWSLYNVSFEDIKTVTPIRTIVSSSGDKILAVYEVATHTKGTRYVVVVENIPQEQADLRRALLGDPELLKGGNLDLMGFTLGGLTVSSERIARSLSQIDGTKLDQVDTTPASTIPAPILAERIQLDDELVVEAIKSGGLSGKKRGQSVKFKAKPQDWYIGIGGGANTSGDGNIGFTYQEGKVGIELGVRTAGGAAKDIYVSPQAIVNGRAISYKIPIYTFPQKSRATDSQLPIVPIHRSNKAPKATSDIPTSPMSKLTPPPAEEKIQNDIDKTQDRLLGRSWFKNPTLNGVLEKRGFKMQDIFDSGCPVYFDQFSFIVDKMPDTVSATTLLEMLAANPTLFINQPTFQNLSDFKPEKRDGVTAIGDIHHINIFGPDDGSVMLVDRAENYFILQTITTDKMGTHPENGAREFGFERLQNGSVRFYTRAAAAEAYNGSKIFAPALQPQAWTSMLEGMRLKIESLGGKVKKENEPGMRLYLEQNQTPSSDFFFWRLHELIPCPTYY